MAGKTIRVLSPAGRAAPPDAHIAARPSSVDGKVLGILDNKKENATALLDAVKEILGGRVKVKEVLYFSKDFPSAPARNLEEISARCDLVINGVGH